MYEEYLNQIAKLLKDYYLTKETEEEIWKFIRSEEEVIRSRFDDDSELDHKTIMRFSAGSVGSLINLLYSEGPMKAHEGPGGPHPAHCPTRVLLSGGRGNRDIREDRETGLGMAGKAVGANNVQRGTRALDSCLFRVFNTETKR